MKPSILRGTHPDHASITLEQAQTMESSTLEHHARNQRKHGASPFRGTNEIDKILENNENGRAWFYDRKGSDFARSKSIGYRSYQQRREAEIALEKEKGEVK